MAQTTVDSGAWIRRFHPAPGSRVKLVCFPHAGGSASFFFPFSQALHPQVEVLSVQYPGRQDRRTEQPAQDIRDLADQIAVALEPWRGDPLALFGHSMGAIVAFEVALRLETLWGTPPVTLFASGRRAPGLRRDETVHLRDDSGVVAELKELSGTEGAFLDDEELLRMVLPAVRADYRAIETYTCPPGVRVNCPVTALAGDRDPRVPVADMRAWSEHTTADFDLHVFDGGHFYLNARRAEVTGVVQEVLGAHV